jgi:hypothetical protein
MVKSKHYDTMKNIGIVESENELVISIIFDRPLNPNFDRLSPSPILGDFPFIVPPKLGGLGGQNIP